MSSARRNHNRRQFTSRRGISSKMLQESLRTTTAGAVRREEKAAFGREVRESRHCVLLSRLKPRPTKRQIKRGGSVLLGAESSDFVLCNRAHPLVCL
jgi:hypothetical protein